MSEFTTYADRKSDAKASAETTEKVAAKRGRPVGSTNSPKVTVPIPALRAYMVRTMAGLNLLPTETLETVVKSSALTVGKSPEFLASDEHKNAAHLAMVDTFAACGETYRRGVFAAIIAASTDEERAFYLAELS